MTDTELAYRDALHALCVHERRLDDDGNTIPMYGVKYTDNVMKGVQYLADIGGVEWKDRSIRARIVADALGYTSVSNCAAMFRECIASGLVHANAVNERLYVTDYGYAQLDMWEDAQDGF